MWTYSGYLPPEYIELQVISETFDIFSLGVIITKIVTGHEGYSNIADMTPRKFVKQVSIYLMFLNNILICLTCVCVSSASF